jgi:hypothetical protein
MMPVMPIRNAARKNACGRVLAPYNKSRKQFGKPESRTGA